MKNKLNSQNVSLYIELTTRCIGMRYTIRKSTALLPSIDDDCNDNTDVAGLISIVQVLMI